MLARVPRRAVLTVRPMMVRAPSTYSTWGPEGKPPCASGTYATREAATRSLYVPYGGPGAYASAQVAAAGAERQVAAVVELLVRVRVRTLTLTLTLTLNPHPNLSIHAPQPTQPAPPWCVARPLAARASSLTAGGKAKRRRLRPPSPATAAMSDMVEPEEMRYLRHD